MRRLLVTLVLLLGLWCPTLSFGQAACTHYGAPTALGNGSGNSPANAMTLTNFINQSGPGQTLCLLDGTYINDGISFTGNNQGSPGNPITIRAINDGGVFINGQYNRRTLYFLNTGYVTVQGIDAGNSAGEVIALFSSHHITIQRVCSWNVHFPAIVSGGSTDNLHVHLLDNSHDNLFEDICGFGYGRNIGGDYGRSTRNTYRRAWFRWDGWPDHPTGGCPGPTIQAAYGAWGATYENIITVYSAGLYDRGWPRQGIPCTNIMNSGNHFRDGITAEQVASGNFVPYDMRGMVDYGYPTNNDLLTGNTWSGWLGRWVPSSWQDVFIDGRHVGNNTISVGPTLFCNLAHDDGSYEPVRCDMSGGINRITSIASPGQPQGSIESIATNVNYCTNPANCPNFFTGDTPGTGARNCFEYQNKVLTSTPLWPWPMDDRIKQALARSGIGPGLQGTAGPGYAAGTPTSEIVSRYGAVPGQCLRGSLGNVPSITSPLTASGQVGTAFSYQIAATNSPTSYNATGLPSGLSVSTSTGLISGTPAAAGTFSVTLSATNASGTGNATLTLTIATTPTLTPIAWWKFDEGTGTTAADATGNGNTLTLTAGPTWQAGRVGPFSLHCDGTGGYAQKTIPFDTSTQQYTFTAWIKGDAAPPTTNGHVVMNGLTSEPWGLSWGHGDPLFRQAWQHRDSSGNYLAAQLTTALVGGVWYHIAATYDGSNVRAYLNGGLQATTAVSSIIAVSGAFTLCGSGAVTPFAGNIDQGKVWNRALSGAEIAQEYNAAATAFVRQHKIVQQ